MHFINYCLIRIFGFFIDLLPTKAVHALGHITGFCAYYLHANFRKKALGNLAIAYGATKSEKERKKIARHSFQSLMITCFEFFRTKHAISLQDNPAVVDLLNSDQGVIFLTGHQANWEIPFIAMTQTHQGVAIGRPIKNKWLYKWVLSVREKHGGKILMPKEAIKEGSQALKSGKFLGIVGDQAYPNSSYSYPLFGTRAWTASTPALLAHKTNSALVVAMTERIGTRYHISASPPILPNPHIPLKEDVPRMMDEALGYLEASIKRRPEQWMWVHDRWKQQAIDHVKREYRHGFVLIALPKHFDPNIPPLLRKIYPRSFLTFLAPHSIPDCDVIPYTKKQELFIRDYRYQLLLDFTNNAKLRRHFRKLGAFKTIALPQQLETIRSTLVKDVCLTTVSL